MLTRETSQTIGPTTAWSQAIGRATKRASRSGKFSAIVFGTSSPTMIEASAITSVTTTNAISSAAPAMSGMSLSSSAR